MFKKLNPLLHNELRLAIMSLIISQEEVDFNLIKEKTKASNGNISVQIKKLEEAKYLKIKKQFKNNYPNTVLIITKTGVNDFETYIKNIQYYFNP